MHIFYTLITDFQIGNPGSMSHFDFLATAREEQLARFSLCSYANSALKQTKSLPYRVPLR